MGKAAALGGGMSMNTGGAMGNPLEDVEAAIAKLREDFEKHKEDYGRELGRLKEDLAQKASKDDLAELEARMLQRMQEMFDQLRAMFPDKEALKKKLAAIEKNVSAVWPQGRVISS